MKPDPAWMVIGGGVVFVGECLRLFDLGLNTQEIAVLLFERECVVDWCVAYGREARLPGKAHHLTPGHGDAALPA